MLSLAWGTSTCHSQDRKYYEQYVMLNLVQTFAAGCLIKAEDGHTCLLPFESLANLNGSTDNYNKSNESP